MLKDNPAVEGIKARRSTQVHRGQFDNRSRESSTKSISDEIKLNGVLSIYEKLIDYERGLYFKQIEEGFKVIDHDARTVIVDRDMAKRIRDGNVDWRALQKNSV